MTGLRMLALMFRNLICSFFLIASCIFLSAQAAGLRIISFAPSVTEWVDALGLSGSLVGVTEQCDFPSRVKNIAKVGSFMRINMEEVLLKKPTDVVTIPGLPAAMGLQLKAKGVRVHEFNVRHLSDFSREILKLGAALGAPEKAQVLSDKMNAAFASLRVEAAKHKKSPRVFLVVSVQPLFVASPQSWLSELFEQIGFRNALRELKTNERQETEFLQISREAALSARADRWFVFSNSSAGEKDPVPLALNEMLSRSLEPVKEMQVLSADLFTRPGPRLAEAARLLKGQRR